MTFRAAALTHCRLQQRFARVIPGAKPMAATLVAAILFLAISAVARADDPGASNDCAGLTPITLTASPDHVVRAGPPSAAADCGLSLELGQLPPTNGKRPPDAEPCIVTATPSPMGNTGLRVRVQHTGDCDGVETRWRVRPSTRNGMAPVSSDTTTTAYSLLIGEDAIGIDMIKNWSEATWIHNSHEVLSWEHRYSSWGTRHAFYIIHPLTLKLTYVDYDGWTVTSEIQQVHVHDNTDVEAINFANFHVHIPVLSDSRAFTSSSIHVEPQGAFHCDYSIKWVANYGFTKESECATR